MTLDALVWVPRMFYYVGPALRGLPPDWFLATAVARDAVVVALMVVVVRTVLSPETDPVRAVGDDDPDWPARSEPVAPDGAQRPERAVSLPR